MRQVVSHTVILHLASTWLPQHPVAENQLQLQRDAYLETSKAYQGKKIVGNLSLLMAELRATCHQNVLICRACRKTNRTAMLLLAPNQHSGFVCLSARPTYQHIFMTMWLVAQPRAERSCPNNLLTSRDSMDGARTDRRQGSRSGQQSAGSQPRFVWGDWMGCQSTSLTARLLKS